jgi:signal peptidase I
MRRSDDERWDAAPALIPDVAPAGPSFETVEPARATADGGGTMTATLERPPADETPPGKGRSPLRNTVEWVVIIGAALLAAIGIKTYLIQAFYIPSASMEHTLNIQDRVLVNKLSYRLHDVHRGDIVVFERPPNDVGQIRDLIKRVVALSGETVEAHDGTVYVDGRPLREPYLEQGVTTAEFPPKRIPDGYIWVMGDNRGNSSDSRVFGAIRESTIIGRAFIRVWPLTALGLL